MIGLLIVLHVVAAGAVLAWGRRWGRWIFAVAAAPLLVAFVALGAQVPDVLDGATPTSRTVWVRALSVEFLFRLDGFALVMALLVAGIGVVVLVYSGAYFAGDPSSDRVVRFAGYFTLFAAAMLGLVVANDVWTLFVFWELTSVMSFLLIGLDDELAGARASAQRALLVTGAGGLAMLGGFVCLVSAAGTTNLQGILAAAPTSTTAQIGVALVLVGAFSKSAQFPFSFWLPGAMVAPTPVTAFLHSATMVNAGVLIVARFSPSFAVLGWWRPVLVVVGGVTMMLGGIAALRRNDAKQLARVRHGIAARVHGRGLRHRGMARDRGGSRADRCARALQIRALPHDRRRGAHDGESGRTPALGRRPGPPVAGRVRRALHPVDDRCATPARLPREGILARRARARWRMGRPLRSSWSCSDRC